ncbi:MAG: transcription antitermination factor NusB [Lachnospiraceae bacterium]|nr:transcription antitermination factor NusB [Lachnospiraceae bacterium]
MGRHEQREQLFKLLFRVEFNSAEEMPEQVQLFFQDDEIEYTEKAMEAIQEKYQLIQEKLPEIDAQLNEKAEGWNTERMGKVELTVLRIAVYEILFDEEVPNTVAINEAIEIAKQYGQAASGGFVNAILAKFVNKQD